MTALPYPHARNDCEMCRERDADFHVLGEQWNQPGKRPLLLCQGCLGRCAVTLLYVRSKPPGYDQPVTITIEPAPERRVLGGTA